MEIVIVLSSVKYSGIGIICSSMKGASVYLIGEYFLKHILINFGIRMHYFKKEF